VLTQCLFPNFSELQVRVDGVGATSRHRDAVDVAARESTRRVSEPRPCRDAVARHRYGEEREKVLEKLGGSKAAPFPRDAVQEALVLDARDRAAAKKRALVEAVPPPPVFDPFEDNLVRASVFMSRRWRHDMTPRRTRRRPRHPPHL
jgi:hypothetical protein